MEEGDTDHHHPPHGDRHDPRRQQWHRGAVAPTPHKMTSALPKGGALFLRYRHTQSSKSW